MGERKRHSPEDLDDGLEHVIYEMWKYLQSVTDYEAITEVGGDAALEFRVLHHRVLLEFFYERPNRHKDNIVANEYITNWEETHSRELLHWLEPYRIRCHTMLAHISTERAEMNRRGLKAWTAEWPPVEKHLDCLIVDFLRGLSEDHKIICRRWIRKWVDGAHVGREGLHRLGALVV